MVLELVSPLAVTLSLGAHPQHHDRNDQQQRDDGEDDAEDDRHVQRVVLLLAAACFCAIKNKFCNANTPQRVCTELKVH